MDLSWHSEATRVDCRACGFTGLGVHVVSFVDSTGEPRRGVRCPECASLDILDVPLDSSPTDASVDVYVEVGAGVGAIADALAQSGSTSVRRMLDVGCNYGFGLDIARRVLGWDVVGVEPSLAGVRGARELGVDIRPEYLTPESDLGGAFDLVMAIEVVEHVPDPVAFLETIRDALTPAGVLVMTTPAAEIVSADERENDVLMALSPGYHVFLASAAGMTRLLHRAGFAAVDVARDHATLRVRAAVEALPTGAVSRFDTARLQDYYTRAGRSARPGSALRLGLVTRGFRLAVARGLWSEARRGARSVRGELRRRYGLDIARPAVLTDRLRAGTPGPWVLPGAAFALGMLELLDLGRPRRAADYFDLTLAAIDAWRTTSPVLDPDTVDLADQAAYHRAFALTRVDPSAVPAAVAAWQPPREEQDGARRDARLSRLAVELVSRGEDAAAEALAPDVAESAIRASSSRDASMSHDGRDGLYATGVLAMRRGSRERALELLQLCVARCAESSDPGATALAQLAHATLASLAPATAAASGSVVTSFLDVYWCDAAGTYVSGWAHVDGRPGDPLTVSIGGRRVIATAERRDDLPAFWADSPQVADAGYSAYVPGPPAESMRIIVTVDGLEVEAEVKFPGHSLPVPPESPSREELQDRILREISAAPPGPILAVGLRRSGLELSDGIMARVGDREIVGVDIHPGHGVDIVADAHRLVDAVGTRRFAVVYSAAFLEHASTPWVFAQQCAAILEPRGIAVHLAPWIWPTHAEPNDFWRFSTAGLERLFSTELGFETVLTGEFGDATIMPSPSWRESAADMPTHTVPTFSCIVARKVRDAEPGDWPYSVEAELERARGYPVQGIVAGAP